MKKTSIYLDPDLDEALGRYAESQGISKAEAIRRAVSSIVQPRQRPRITAIAVGEGPEDLARNAERYLAEGFGED